MVIATKDLPIERGYSPDLEIHMGEVNRQYILVPSVDINGYSVRSEIVKPDGTFVYTDQSINTDGNILFTIPEQAGAVAGYGHYIIKIYNLNTVVYSCVGTLRIDDHLILDGMIESVADVNGYTFPDDFMMRGELEGVFNDTTVSNETGWTSTKINNEIDALLDDTITANNTGWTSTKIKDYVDQSVLENYSTSERVVGKWIDGKPIYQKTVSFTVPSNTYETKATGITDFNKCVGYTGIVEFSNGIFEDINYNRPDSSNSTFYVAILSDGNVFFSTYESITATAYITIRYTKTTD